MTHVVYLRMAHPCSRTPQRPAMCGIGRLQGNPQRRSAYHAPMVHIARSIALLFLIACGAEETAPNVGSETSEVQERAEQDRTPTEVEAPDEAEVEIEHAEVEVEVEEAEVEVEHAEVEVEHAEVENASADESGNGQSTNTDERANREAEEAARARVEAMNTGLLGAVRGGALALPTDGDEVRVGSGLDVSQLGVGAGESFCGRLEERARTGTPEDRERYDEHCRSGGVGTATTGMN